MKKVGVLGLQGAVSEHVDRLAKLENVKPLVVKYKNEIEAVDALIIPGGESTAIGKLLADFELTSTLKSRILSGMPVWGTCAGMIILAKKLCNDERRHLEVMDIEVMRNGYGRQIDSFSTTVNLPELSANEIPLVFIRAPYVVNAAPNVKVLLRVNDKIVACRQENMLATSFHPELTEDLSFHKYFVDLIKAS
ncbi:pyridoxal 5'-phosphate synthase glutaminase subunit PdxT [Ruminiclostridium herbifermentans]|uniref:Pyridoxal 5'-phosphate synthase subunit PdxT n=1 Tax=Ruminiclostridium herbifermentans TaxID=2488810 RepID=A0A4U7JNE9_9FIRM|nr:pyridoxal 5'-phosphate synthase glutaminase subunit PdxT [Ruminiclostridium herbifermentans]QNU68512.1 pyridoxal 5'-phosphate synthase glutaminase subunit PdxT [Ruminiclostridium herbifermentans]